MTPSPPIKRSRRTVSGITQVTQQLSESVGKAEICYVISTPDGEKLMHLFPEEGKKQNRN